MTWISRTMGGVQRGDRAETGDLEARRKDGVSSAGSGVPAGQGGTTELGGDSDLEDLTIHDASDPDLGLTGIGEVPARDWAAATGPTRSGEAGPHGVDDRLEQESRTPSGRKVDFED